MSQTIFLDWNDDRVGTWDGNDFVWEFVAIIVEETQITLGGSTQTDYAKKKEKKRIKLTTFIENKEITEIKEIKSIPGVFISDVSLKNTQNITLEIKF